MAGKPSTKFSAMAKYYASEISVQISTDAVQIFGGYGYTKDFLVEKFYRDSKLCTIGEGYERDSEDSDSEGDNEGSYCFVRFDS